MSEDRIRNGTGVGVGAPQWRPRRGFFGGLEKTFDGPIARAADHKSQL
jgi:hypothetical protein